MPEQAATRTITHDDHLRLLGLALLLDESMRQQQQLKEAVAGIVGEKPDDHGFYGHVDDWAYSLNKRDPRDLLSSLGIEVEPPAEGGRA